MKNFVMLLVLLGLVWYLHRQQRWQFFLVWEELNSLKLRGGSYGALED